MWQVAKVIPCSWGGDDLAGCGSDNVLENALGQNNRNGFDLRHLPWLTGWPNRWAQHTMIPLLGHSRPLSIQSACKNITRSGAIANLVASVRFYYQEESLTILIATLIYLAFPHPNGMGVQMIRLDLDSGSFSRFPGNSWYVIWTEAELSWVLIKSVA